MGEVFENPPDEHVRRILSEAENIAVVGASDDPERPSYRVAAYLQQQGYRIIPVNPKLDSLLGEKAYPSLKAVPDSVRVDIVDVFRRSEAVPEIAEEAAAGTAGCLWLQEGVISVEGVRPAQDAGLEVVMDRCIKKEHARLCAS